MAGMGRLPMRLSARRRLQLLTGLAGVAFVFCALKAPALPFAQLPHAFPTSFRARHGFFHVLRWLEHGQSPDELAAFLSAMAAFHHAEPAPPSATSGAKGEGGATAFRSADELLAQLRRVAQWDSYLSLSKVVLQWSLLVFLSHAKTIRRRVAISCVCLCIVSLVCAKVAQSLVLELLAQPPPAATARDRATFMAAFVGMLFLVRVAATAFVNGVMARAYQSYFGGWPARWRDVPRYIGSKRFALSTLFYGTAAVSAMALSATPLRSLSEAAHQIESVALAAAFAHFAAHDLGLTTDVTPSSSSTATATATEKKRQ